MRKLLALLLLLAPAAAGASSVAVYHTSDVHGWYFARPAAWDNANRTRLIGGFAALSALLKKETTPYMLLDSGDMFQGTPEGILTRGMASVALMDKLGYSAAVPGNHDYDYGEGVLKTMISGAAFPFVGANLYYRKDGRHADYLKPWVMVEKGGRKIAVLGLLGRHTATSTMPSGVKHLDFRDEAEEAAKWLPEIQKEHPDAVVVIAHLGIDTALSIKNVDISARALSPQAPSTLYIARAAPSINLVLGGHDHTGLINGYHDKTSGAWFGEPGYGLSYVTRAELNFDDRTGKLAGVAVKLIPLWIDRTGQDPAVLAMVDGYKKQVEEKMGGVIGAAQEDFTLAGPLDSKLGDWACDITIKAMGTLLAFHNTHGFRAPIRKVEVRLRDLYQAMPFDNTIVTMTVTGAQIAQMLRDNVQNGMSDMQVGGLEVTFRRAPDGSAVDIHLYRGGREIKPTDVFTAATNSYLADGGDGGAVFTAEKSKSDTLVPARDIMIDAVKAGPVAPPATGRIREIAPPDAPPVRRVYKDGETFSYLLKLTYTEGTRTREPSYSSAAVTVQKGDDGVYYETWRWLGRVEDGKPEALPQSALDFRQRLSLDPAFRLSMPPDFFKALQLAEPISDALTFYADAQLAARKGLRLSPGDQLYIPYGKPASWAGGPTLTGFDCVDFVLSVSSVNAKAGTATLKALHVPPPFSCAKAPAPWLQEQLFGMPNNWYQVRKEGEAYRAGAGLETFDDVITISLADGHIVSATQYNPLAGEARNCKDEALTDCGAPEQVNILRQLELTEIK